MIASLCVGKNWVFMTVPAAIGLVESEMPAVTVTELDLESEDERVRRMAHAMCRGARWLNNLQCEGRA